MRRRETAEDDDARTVRLLEALEGRQDPDSLSDFDATVLYGCVASQTTEYPPPGHQRPKRG